MNEKSFYNIKDIDKIINSKKKEKMVATEILKLYRLEKIDDILEIFQMKINEKGTILSAYGTWLSLGTAIIGIVISFLVGTTTETIDYKKIILVVGILIILIVIEGIILIWPRKKYQRLVRIYQELLILKIYK